MLCKEIFVYFKAALIQLAKVIKHATNICNLFLCLFQMVCDVKPFEQEVVAGYFRNFFATLFV